MRKDRAADTAPPPSTAPPAPAHSARWAPSRSRDWTRRTSHRSPAPTAGASTPPAATSSSERASVCDARRRCPAARAPGTPSSPLRQSLHAAAIDRAAGLTKASREHAHQRRARLLPQSREQIPLAERAQRRAERLVVIPSTQAAKPDEQLKDRPRRNALERRHRQHTLEVRAARLARICRLLLPHLLSANAASLNLSSPPPSAVCRLIAPKLNMLTVLSAWPR